MLFTPRLLMLCNDTGTPSPEEMAELLAAARRLSHDALTNSGDIQRGDCRDIRRLLARLDAEAEDVAQLLAFADKYDPPPPPAWPAPVVVAPPAPPPAEPALVAGPAQAVSSRKLKLARAAHTAASDAASRLRDEIVRATAAETDAKKRAGDTDAADDWESWETTKKQVARLGVKLEKAAAEETSAKAELDRLERFRLLAAFDAERVQSGDRVLRAKLEPIVAAHVEIRRQLADLEQRMLGAIVEQHSACDRAREVGRALGMSERDVTDALRRDRGPIGFNPQAFDLSERRPVAAVDAWIALLSSLQSDTPLQVDAAQARAARTGAQVDKPAESKDAAE